VLTTAEQQRIAAEIDAALAAVPEPTAAAAGRVVCAALLRHQAALAGEGAARDP
jgi:hypothetical protein